jgi:hypothetical protein
MQILDLIVECLSLQKNLLEYSWIYPGKVIFMYFIGGN